MIIIKKLDFIIVGTMKSGTSSLAYHMNNHFDIHIPENEIHFFNNDKFYKKGFKYYHDRVGLENKSNKLIGEKTPTYSYLKKVPKRIYDYNPNIKLIWIFRNPVDRTYSNYLHAFKKGVENLPFEEAIKKEEKRIKTDIWKGYKKRSIYIEQVQRYLKYFDKKQMKFLLFEEFIKNPKTELIKVFDFLGLDTNRFEYVKEKRNKTVLPRFQRLLYYSQNILGSESLIYKIIRKLSILGKKPGYPNLKDKTRNELNKYFHEYNIKLKKVTNLKTEKWS